jgi:hypothetical protein
MPQWHAPPAVVQKGTGARAKLRASDGAYGETALKKQGDAKALVTAR